MVSQGVLLHSHIIKHLPNPTIEAEAQTSGFILISLKTVWYCNWSFTIRSGQQPLVRSWPGLHVLLFSIMTLDSDRTLLLHSVNLFCLALPAAYWGQQTLQKSKRAKCVFVNTLNTQNEATLNRCKLKRFCPAFVVKFWSDFRTLPYTQLTKHKAE